MDYLVTKQETVVCRIKLYKNKKVSAVLVHGTVKVSWKDNDPLGMLAVL